MDSDAWRELDQWVADQTPNDQAYIEENTRLGALTPTVQQLYGDVKLLEEYWDIQDNHIETLPPAQRFLWRKYSEDAISRRELASSVSSITKVIDMKQERWILTHPNKGAVDTALLRWEYSTDPKTREGQEYKTNRLKQIRRSLEDYGTGKTTLQDAIENAKKGLQTGTIPEEQQPDTGAPIEENTLQKIIDDIRRGKQ